MKYGENILKTFLTVTEEQSFSKAAIRLHMSQSAVTKEIKALEHFLGMDLFVRNKIPKQLNDNGAEFRLIIIDFVGKVKQFKQTHVAASHTLTGELNLCCSDSLPGDDLYKALTEFCSTYPKVHLNITSDNYMSTFENVDGGVFILLPVNVHLPNIKTIKLYNQCPLGILIPKGIPLSNKRAITINDLINFNIITSHLIYDNTNLKKWLNGHEPLCLCDNFQALISMVDVGGGIAIVPLTFSDYIQNTSLKMVPLYPSVSVQQKLVYCGTTAMNLLQKTFVNFLN